MERTVFFPSLILSESHGLVEKLLTWETEDHTCHLLTG